MKLIEELNGRVEYLTLHLPIERGELEVDRAVRAWLPERLDENNDPSRP
jgi:hypothetical protein